MTIASHPSEALLLDYATGAVPPGPELTLAAHLERCPHCRDQTQFLEGVGESLVSSLPDEAPAADFESRLVALAQNRPAPLPAGPPTLGGVALPAAAAAVGFGPRRWMGPGYWLAHAKAPSVDGWRTYLLRAPAGGGLPTHSHHGAELLTVLEGEFSDGDGRYGPGDFAEAEGDHRHGIHVLGDSPCVCLISTQGLLRFSGWMQLLQPLVGV